MATDMNPAIADFATAEANKYFPAKNELWLAFYMGCVSGKRDEQHQVEVATKVVEAELQGQINSLEDEVERLKTALQKANKRADNVGNPEQILGDINVLRELKARLVYEDENV